MDLINRGTKKEKRRDEEFELKENTSRIADEPNTRIK
jgi:hypothetical protein